MHKQALSSERNVACRRFPARRELGVAATWVLLCAAASGCRFRATPQVGPAADAGASALTRGPMAPDASRALAADGGTPRAADAGSSGAATATAAAGGAGAAAERGTAVASDAGRAPRARLDAGEALDADTRAQDSSEAGPMAVDEASCAAELAACLVADPLGYASCLRVNAEHNCPLPDSGAPSTPPPTKSDGGALSVACQAQLADCIMRNPTPQNAAECMKLADSCTL